METKSRKVSVPVKLPKYLPPDDVRKLWKSVNNYRWRFLIQTLYFAGLRATECSLLTDSSINIKEKYVIINWNTAKRKTERQIVVCQEYLDLAKEFMNIPREQERWFPWSRTRIWQKLKGYMLAAGFARDVCHPHTLRHSYAVALLTACDRLDLVSDQLGHKNLSSTKIYTKLCVTDRRKRLENVNI